MDEIKEKVLDDTFTTDLGGESRDFVESSSNTSFAFGLALLLIYLILAAQFESFIDPFIIILTVPMAVAGALFSLWLFGQTWNIFSQIGTVMLIGLVTKNGILIVEFAVQRRKSGLSIPESALEGAKSRLRPIIMTSLAFIAGMIPLMFASGGTASGNKSISTGAAFGMLSGVVLGVIVIPILFMFFQYLQERVSRKPTTH